MAALDPLPSPRTHVLASEVLVGAAAGAALAGVINLYAFMLGVVLEFWLSPAGVSVVFAFCRLAIVALPVLGAVSAARQALRALPAPP